MEQVYHDAGDATPASDERALLREQLIGPEAKRALAFQTVAVRHFGPAAGIFLRQLLYRDGSGWDGDFWIYKSMKEWDEETGLKRRQQEKARKVLTGKGMMEEKKANGPDGRQRLFFRVDPWAVMEVLGDELPHAQPSTNAQGCTVLLDKDHVQYYQAGTMSDISAQAVQKTTQKKTQKNPPGGAGAPHEGESKEEGKVPDTSKTSTPSSNNQQHKAARELAEKLHVDLEERGQDLDEVQWEKDRIHFKLLIDKGVDAGELQQVRERIVERRTAPKPYKLSPQDAFGDIRGGTATKSNPTPPAGIEAIRSHVGRKPSSTSLRKYASLAEHFDFTSDEEPPRRIFNQLGGATPDTRGSAADLERYGNLKRLRSVCKRAVKEARGEGVAKMGPFNTPESSATAARMDSPGLEHGLETTTPEDAEGNELGVEANRLAAGSKTANFARAFIVGKKIGAEPVTHEHVAAAAADELDMEALGYTEKMRELTGRTVARMVIEQLREQVAV